MQLDDHRISQENLQTSNKRRMIQNHKNTELNFEKTVCAIYW